MIKSSNPTLTLETFNQFRTSSYQQKMTLSGTVNKTFLLLAIVLMSASFTWSQFLSGNTGLTTTLMIAGAILGFIFAIITTFKKEKAAVTAPLYAAFQGLFLGGFSSMLEVRYPGIVIQGVGLTFATLFCLLGAYKSGLIKPTENFKLGLSAAIGGLMGIYFLSFVVGLFGISIPLFGAGPIGIIFSFVVVGIAALTLVMDFDFIEQGVEDGAPAYMEWYSAFGLMVTLIWLYIEIMRLLVKLQQRD